MFSGYVPEMYTICVLFVAYFVRGIAGFGSGLIAIPLLALYYPITLVVPLVVLLDFLGSNSQSIRSRKNIRWFEILPLLPFTIIGCVTALYLFKTADIELLTKAMAIFIIVFALYQLFQLPALKGSRIWACPAGLTGGLVGTLFGTGGPFYMIYLNVRSLDKFEIRASFAAYFGIDGSIRIMGFVFIGLIGLAEIKTLLFWLPPMALGLFAGGKIHTDISPKTFKFFISLLLVFSGYRLLMR